LTTNGSYLFVLAPVFPFRPGALLLFLFVVPPRFAPGSFFAFCQNSIGHGSPLASPFRNLRRLAFSTCLVFSLRSSWKREASSVSFFCPACPFPPSVPLFFFFFPPCFQTNVAARSNPLVLSRWKTIETREFCTTADRYFFFGLLAHDWTSLPPTRTWGKAFTVFFCSHVFITTNLKAYRVLSRATGFFLVRLLTKTSFCFPLPLGFSLFPPPTIVKPWRQIVSKNPTLSVFP